VKLAVIKESRPGESRVAIVPEVAAKLAKLGVETAVQTGAGDAARFSDADYEAAGATVVADAAAALAGADIVAHVQTPTVEEVATLPQGTTVISFLQPVASSDVVKAMADKGMTAFSFDLLPRISRAQSMDALSSQATVAGYRAGLAAAEELAKFFPMFMTAAGTVPPAKVLVMGAGVAGLQAIATARRLGATVRAYDVRTAAKEEVQSLGAKFVELDLEAQDGAGGY
jgi:NAD(P) transhydrogenase subunit alpha